MRYSGLAAGYSLYELVMTVAVISVVLGLGVPSFSNMAANARIRVEIDRLFHAIHLARKESIVRRRVMTICPTLDGENCDPDGDWSTGWIVFSNKDRDWPAIRDPDEAIIRHVKIDSRIRITANRKSFSLRSTQLRATNGTLVVCDHRGRGRARALVVSYTGRPRVAYETSRGTPYQCAD